MKPTGSNRKIYRVRLDDEEREKLRGTVDGGGSRERRRRAHVLLLAAGERPGGGYMDAGIADVVGVGTSTVERIRRRCGGEGLEAALERKERLNRKKRVLDGTGEARLVTLACSRPPEGHAKWTLQLPGDRLVEPGLSTASPKKQLEERQQKRYKPWKQKRWCIPPGQNAEFVCAIEDVLNVHRREYGDDEVLVCMDETSRQLTKETRIPVPARPGRPARCACEYERNGTVNLFMAHAPLLGRRHGRVTERRTKQDFAGLPGTSPMSTSRKRGSCP